ncbi:MAG TPA: zf-HC2 domain-containing protein [Actinomycetota bacterium]
MRCLEVRELLPELAVGVLSPEERTEVERHLQWCAGCRKEASELGQAAATLAFTLEPAPVPHGLGERIVERVKRAAGAPGTQRRARTAAASIVAAMVAIAGLGWGSVMAGRAERFEARAAQAEMDRAAALERFQRILNGVVPDQELPVSETHLGQLTPTAEGRGGGAVLQLVSDRMLDFTVVIVNGLDPADVDALPYAVELENAAGVVVRAGQILELDADGGAEVFRQFRSRDLTGFTKVRVVDATGRVVLVGSVDQST